MMAVFSSMVSDRNCVNEFIACSERDVVSFKKLSSKFTEAVRGRSPVQILAKALQS